MRYAPVDHVPHPGTSNPRPPGAAPGCIRHVHLHENYMIGGVVKVWSDHLSNFVHPLDSSSLKLCRNKLQSVLLPRARDSGSMEKIDKKNERRLHAFSTVTCSAALLPTPRSALTKLKCSRAPTAKLEWEKAPL